MKISRRLLTLGALLLSLPLMVSSARPTRPAFNIFAPRTATVASPKVKQLKEALLSKAAEVDRGLKETPADREVILGLIKELEAKNPTKKPNTSPLVSARWRLVYTTSDSILGKTRPAPFRPAGDILQIIDGEKGTVRNEESLRPLPFLPAIPEAIDATIAPEGDKRVNVQFKKLTFGPLKLNFESNNWLDITFLDSDTRISRGGRGNVFVLVRD